MFHSEPLLPRFEERKAHGLPWEFRVRAERPVLSRDLAPDHLIGNGAGWWRARQDKAAGNEPLPTPQRRVRGVVLWPRVEKRQASAIQNAETPPHECGRF